MKYIPQDEGKARGGWKPQRSRPPQLEHARRRSRSKGPKKRSAAPSPARGHTPQEKNITIRVDRVQQAANYVMRNGNLETITYWIEQLDKRQEELEEGERRAERRGQLVPCRQTRTGSTQTMQNRIQAVVTAGTRPEAMRVQVLRAPAVVVPNFVTAVVTAGRVDMIPRTLAT